MGCCCSGLRTETHPESTATTTTNPSSRTNGTSRVPPAPPTMTAGVLAFSDFSLVELKAATAGFNSENIVSESREKGSNIVYKGQLLSLRWIAVKKFTMKAWSDPKQFAEEA